MDDIAGNYIGLIHAELLQELDDAGFALEAGEMGENITTTGIDHLSLPAGTRLLLSESAIVEVTGLRNPCTQLDGIHPGLMAATLGRDDHGDLIRKVGVMSIVTAGGEVRPGDLIRLELPASPRRRMGPRLSRSRLSNLRAMHAVWVCKI